MRSPSRVQTRRRVVVERRVVDARVDNSPLLMLGLPLGVIGLDRHGRVLSRNYAAYAILEERDGLTFLEGRLVASRQPHALRRLVAEACANDGAEAAGGALQIVRRAPRRPVTLFAAPLRWPSIPDTMPAALVLLSDPEREPPRLDDVLGRLYGLTRTETEVAFLVLEGARAEDVAQRRGTSLNTARTHIKRVLGKVGVQSQVELVRVLLAGPVPDTSFRPAAVDGGNGGPANGTASELGR